MHLRRERLSWRGRGDISITPHGGDHGVARVGGGYPGDRAPDGRNGGTGRGRRRRLRLVPRPRPGRAGEPRSSGARQSSWRFGVAARRTSRQRGIVRGDSAARGARSGRSSDRAAGAASGVRRRATGWSFRGGALCGPSLLERLLRGLLSELLGFLRALHVSSSWSVSSSALVGMTRKPRQGESSSSRDRRRPRMAIAHAEYRTDP